MIRMPEEKYEKEKKESKEDGKKRNRSVKN
jgi:hypothetical protein